MWDRKWVALALALGSALFPLLAASQPPTHPPDMMEVLNKEAEATDPAGIHAYIEQLVQMLPSVRGGGVAYADTLTDRLARAELMARNGKRKLISEIDIVKAFNDLMRQTGAPGSLEADLAAVESARSGSEKQLPALISRERNGTYCYPGESVFILEMLIENVGRPPVSIPDSAPKVFVSVAASPARRHLELFCARHSQSEVTAAFDHLFSAFQI